MPALNEPLRADVAHPHTQGAPPPTMLEHALAHAARGWHVLPLRENGKLPVTDNGHLAATTDSDQIRAWWRDPLTGSTLPHNVGVRPTAGQFAVIDLDTKQGVDGPANYVAAGGVIDGLVCATPSGGLHVYVALSGTDIATSAGRIVPGCDSRSSDGYVVAPGSTIDGKAYELISDGPMLPVPAFVIERVPARSERPAVVTSYAIADDQERNLERFIDACRRAPGALPGVWHDASRDLACEAVRCAVSVERATEIMLAEWVPRGSGFLDDGRGDRWPADVAGSYAWASAQGEHGVHSVDAQLLAFEGLTIVPPPPDMSGQADLSAPSRSRLHFTPQPECHTGEPRRYVVKGLIARGDLCIVLGAPGAGKSAFTPFVCQAVASGGAAFGRRTRQGEAWYVAAEDPHGLKGRMQALGDRYGSVPAFVLVGGVSDLFTSAGQAVELLQSVRERKPAVVVIDTLAAAFPGLRESESDDMGRVIAFARQLATGADGAPGPAVILVHHTPKAGDTPRGHSSLNGAADVVILLTRDEDSGIVSARLTKNRNGPAFGVEMAFQIESALIGLDEDGDDISAALTVEVEASSLRKERGLSGQVRTCLVHLDTLILDAGPDVQAAPAELVLAGVPLGGCAGVLTAAWQAACELHGASGAEAADSRAKAFRRAKKALLERRLIVELGERVYRLRGAGE